MDHSGSVDIFVMCSFRYFFSQQLKTELDFVLYDLSLTSNDFFLINDDEYSYCNFVLN